MSLKRRQKVEPEFSLAAMIDVIFLLLMFFMLTSKFVTPNALNLSLPSSTSTTMADPSLGVSIDADGNYYIEFDNRATKVAKENLLASIQQKILSLKKDPQSTTITIVSEKTASVDQLVYVLNIANQLKVKTILATDPEPGK